MTHLLVVPVTFLPELRAEHTTATLFWLRFALHAFVSTSETRGLGL